MEACLVLVLADLIAVVEAIGMRNAVPLEVKYAACDGAARAKEWVVGGAVCDALAFHRILLVSERERDLRHTIDVRVIQRCDDGSADAAAHGDGDVADAEGLGASLGVVAGMEVFGGAEHPEEADDAEIEACPFSVDIRLCRVDTSCS